MSPAAAHPRDWPRPVEWLLGCLAVLVGSGLGVLVYLDGLYGHRLQVKILGVMPALVNDVPWLWTLLGAVLIAAFGWLLAWVRLTGSWDRPLLGILVFSLYATVIPAIYQGALLGVVLLLVERGIRKGDIPIRFGPMFFFAPAVAVLYYTTMLQTERIGNVLSDSVFRLSYVVMLLLLPSILCTRRHLETVLHYMILAGLVGATVGLVQFALSYVTGRPITFASEEVVKISTPWGFMIRCTGLMAHPNHQGNCLGSTATLLAWFFTRPAGQLSRSRRLYYMAAWFWICLGCIVTWSRSTWLGLAVTHFFIPVVRWPRIAVPYFLSWGAVVAAGLETGVLQKLYEIVKEFNVSSADFRWHMDAIAAQSFLYEPWIGRGVGGMIDYFNPYHLEVHNTYLQIAAELGIAGLTVFGLLGAGLSLRLFWVLLRPHHPEDREWVVGVILASGVILIQNMFAMFLWIKYFWFLLALMESVILVSRRQPTDAEPSNLAFLPRPAGSGLLVHGT